MNYRVRKGNRAETAVRNALRGQGFLVRDGPHNESGCDLYVIRRDRYLDHEAEVKSRKEGVNSLLPKEKRVLARRAWDSRELGIPYKLYFVRWDGSALPPTASIYSVGAMRASPIRNGLHLDLFGEGLLNLSTAYGPPLGGGNAPPLPESGWATDSAANDRDPMEG